MSGILLIREIWGKFKTWSTYRIQRSKDDIANLIDDAHLEGYENKI